MYTPHFIVTAYQRTVYVYTVTNSPQIIKESVMGNELVRTIKFSTGRDMNRYLSTYVVLNLVPTGV
eukprot:SAG31_NODE_1148_length_9661_cov_24.669839_3_plen_66_part_00